MQRGAQIGGAQYLESPTWMLERLTIEVSKSGLQFGDLHYTTRIEKPYHFVYMCVYIFIYDNFITFLQ